MRIKVSKLFITAGFIILVFVGIIAARQIGGPSKENNIKLIHPRVGDISSFISTTGAVLPKNRLEVKPPVNGRIEKILVKEGDMVKTGGILAWMSSTERAALMDAARGQGEEAVKYWQDIYKGIPIIAPIDGEVIVETVQPGQTVTTSDAIVVLSDRLIIRAEIDETDIAGIKKGQDAKVTIDAYPDEKIDAKVDHIYYESKTVNNVTIYEADLAPEEIPPFLRSGMNATIEFISKTKKNALLLPVEALHREKNSTYVLIEQDNKEIKRPVTAGITDDKDVEILEGLTADSEVIVKGKKYALPKAPGASPLLPSRRR